jgi:hypothetical protein
MKLIALTEFYYDNRSLRPGDEFYCHGETDARVLTAPDGFGGQKARRVDGQARAPVQPPIAQPALGFVQTDNPESASSQQAHESEHKPARRKYRRRDLVSED